MLVTNGLTGSPLAGVPPVRPGASAPPTTEAPEPEPVPTPAAQDAVDRAAGAVDLLAALDRSMTFVQDGAGGPIHAEVRDGSGALVRRMSLSDALTLLDALGTT